MGCLQSYFRKAQNAALSPSSTHHEGLNNGTELLTADKQQPVTQTVVTTKSPAPQPPKSQASDSGAASAASSPAVSPSRSPGPQTVRAKLTTTANKHPSPVFQQAIKTAFNAESLISDRASKSPAELRKIISPSSPGGKESENSNQNKSTPSTVSRSTVTSPVENTEEKKSESVSGTPDTKETDGVKSPESNIDKITASELIENASSPVALARSSESSSPRQKEEGDGSEERVSSELEGIKSPSDENKEDLGERRVSGASQNENEIQAVNNSENIEDKTTKTSRAASKNEVTSPEPEIQDKVSAETPVVDQVATTSSAETQSEQKEGNQEEKEIAEKSGSTLSKRASELGSEDFKPQTPDIVCQSPDQSTYDDVSATVLVEDETSPRVEFSDVTEEQDETETQQESEDIVQVESQSPKLALEDNIEEEKTDVNEQEIVASEIEEEIKSVVQVISPVQNENQNEELEKVEISTEQSDKVDTPAPEESLNPEEGESSPKLVTPTPPPSPVRSEGAAGSQAGSRMSQTEEIDQASGEMEKIRNSVIELAKLEGESEEKAETNTPEAEVENKSGEEGNIAEVIDAAPEAALKEIENVEETEPQEEVSNSEKPEIEETAAEESNENAAQVETSEQIEASEVIIEDNKEIIVDNTAETVEITSEENAETEKEIADDKNEVSEAGKVEENMRVALDTPSETGELIGNIVESQSHQSEDANVSCPADEEKNDEFAPTAPLETPDKDAVPPRACSNLSVLCECTSAPVEPSAVNASAVDSSETEGAVTSERDAEVINTEGKSETLTSEENVTTEDDKIDTIAEINTENKEDSTLNENKVESTTIKSDSAEAIEEISETKVAQAVETAVEQLYEEIASTTPDEGDLIRTLSMETPQETGELLAVQSSTEQETVVQILHEDATPSDSQSSLVGNEGLGAVTGVVIRYSISETNDPDKQQNLANEETDKNEDEASCVVEQEIAETIIAAVRDSEDTPTETASISGGDAVQASVSEPAEVTSAQTSSSKDAASLELDDVEKEAIIVEPIDLSTFDESDKVECVVLSEDNTNDKAGEITLESPQFPIEDISIDTAVQQEMVESPSSGEQVPKQSVPDKIILEERKIPEKTLSIAERELEEAATTIQSSFRGYHSRKASDLMQEAQNTVVPAVVARVLDDSEEEAETSTNQEGEVADTSRAFTDLDEIEEEIDNKQKQLLEDIETTAQTEVENLEKQVSDTVTEIKNTASADILESREQISEAVNEIIDEAVAVTESVQEMVTSEVPVEIVSSGLAAGVASAAAAAIMTSTDSTSPPQVWHAVPAQVFEDEEALLSETEAKLEASRARNEEPSALVELLQNSTLVAATPLAYIDPIPIEMSRENNSTLDLIQNSTLIASTPLAFTDSSTPPSVSHPHLQNTYSSSGECADVSASMTEPISWNGESRTLDQESGEMVTADEDDGVWATLEKELGETQELVDAATKIQAGFRGHKTRQSLLQREDAVQIVSSSGASGDTTPFSGVRHTGEFHDSLPLLPLSGERPSELEDATHFTRLQNAQQQDDEDMTSSGSESFLDRAATKIQSTFRGFKTRNDIKKEKSPVRNCDIDAATKIQAGYRGYKVRKDMKEDKLPRIQSAPQIFVHTSIEDDSATKIQAGVRGYLTRQRLKKERSPQPSPPPSPAEVQDAVVKIQAGFRGYKARQEVKSMKEGNTT